MAFPFHVNGVQTLAFDPDAVRAHLADPALDAHDVAPEFARLFGVAPGFQEDPDADEDEERARLEDLEYAAAVEQWRAVWPQLLRQVRGGATALELLPSAAVYSFILEGGVRVGRPIDIPPERGPLVDWLLDEGLERWLGVASLGVAGLELHDLFRSHVLDAASIAARLASAAPATEVVTWCPAARDPSAAFALERMVDGLASNLRGAAARPKAVAVFPNYVRFD